LKSKLALASAVLVTVTLIILSAPSATASLCQTIQVSFAYPRQALPNRSVPITTTVAGSCTSDGEDYFGLRVDVLDGVSHGVLSSNSTPIGYNANNFSVNVENAAVSPANNQSWPLQINTYLIQAGGTSGKYLLNATTITIQVGDSPLPEIPLSSSPLMALVLIAVTMSLTRRKLPHRTKAPRNLCGDRSS